MWLLKHIHVEQDVGVDVAYELGVGAEEVGLRHGGDFRFGENHDDLVPG